VPVFLDLLPSLPVRLRKAMYPKAQTLFNYVMRQPGYDNNRARLLSTLVQMPIALDLDAWLGTWVDILSLSLQEKADLLEDHAKKWLSEQRVANVVNDCARAYVELLKIAQLSESNVVLEDRLLNVLYHEREKLDHELEGVIEAWYVVLSLYAGKHALVGQGGSLAKLKWAVALLDKRFPNFKKDLQKAKQYRIKLLKIIAEIIYYRAHLTSIIKDLYQLFSVVSNANEALFNGLMVYIQE